MDTIYVDTREKPHAITGILAEFERRNVAVVHQKLDEGDYMSSPSGTVTVDRKQNLEEICGNLTWQKARFQRELRRAATKGKTLYILCEHGEGIQRLDDVKGWKNPRRKESPKALDGKRLYQMMLSYAAKYGVKWRFCEKHKTGLEILRILESEAVEGGVRDGVD